MLAPRFMSDAVLLPDETVLVVNGAGRGSADSSHGPVYTAEIFDSRTETWTAGARINRPRLYHSTAALLPDGRVMIAGNTQTFNPGNPTEDRTVEIYSPPYLFRGTRPIISSAPKIVPYGQDFRIGTPDPAAIASVSLMRAGSVTHTNDMDQRHLILPIRRREPGAIVVGAPASGTVSPPGPHILFLLNGDRIPSTGYLLEVRPEVRDAAYLSQAVPTQVRVGERFSVRVTLQNTGTLTWTRGQQHYRLASQSPQDDETWGLSRVDLPAPEVPPGASATFDFAATAPKEAGAYAFQWRMVHEGVEWFGPATPAVRIVVKGDTEPPECDSIRAQLIEINARVLELQDRLTGHSKHDAPIIRQINQLQAQARTLTSTAQRIGCVISIVPHH